ncbi:STAS domain-containing protein [Streptomyces sp. TRM70308]|uniref:STAS domain-containing protein n=1 Tax=Streptomyces sp. TRM70308 TaxID=3131932 RepID=UPI003D039F09
MSERSLTVATQPHPAGARVVTVTGELDLDTAPRLRDTVEELAFHPGARTVFDLTGLTYCDSTGITVLVTAHQRAQAAGSSLHFVGLSSDLLRVFQIVGLDQVFSLHPSLDQALA